MEDRQPKGTVQKMMDVICARNWNQGGHEVAYTLGSWTILGGIAAYGIHKVVHAVKEYREYEAQAALLRKKFEIFAAHYEQLIGQAVKMSLAAAHDVPMESQSLMTFFAEQKKQGGYEFLEFMSAQVGVDILQLLEVEFIKPFDEVIMTPAANKEDRIAIAFYNLRGFAQGLFEGNLRKEEVPAAEPVAKSAPKPVAEPTKPEVQKKSTSRSPRRNN